MQTSSPFDSLQMPKELACEFFAVFSRFEYALKESGFWYLNRNGRAAPNWDGFAAIVTLEFESTSELANAIDFLNDEPPLVQVSSHDWLHAPLRGTTKIQKALDATQRIRNNLFHGGKHMQHSHLGRDEKLVKSALEVLLSCISQNSALRAAYS